VVRGKAINHLHGRGLDRRTVYQSIPIYLVSRGVPRADFVLELASSLWPLPWRHTYQTSSGWANAMSILVCAFYSSGWRLNTV